MKSYLEKTVLPGFLLSISVLLLIGYASYKNGEHAAESVGWIEHTHVVIETLDRVLADVREAESEARGFIISGDESYLSPFHETSQSGLLHLKKLRSLIADNRAQLKRVSALDSLISQKLTRLNSGVEKRKGESSMAMAMAPHTGVGKRLMDDIQSRIREMQDVEGVLLVQRTQQLLDQTSLSRLVDILGSFGAITMLAGLYFLLRTEMRTRNSAQAEMRRANNFLNAVLENIPNMIFVKDATDLRFVRFNKAGEELLGYKKSDLIGKNDYDFFPKEQADVFVNNDRAVLRKGQLLDIKEEPIETRLNGLRWLHTKKIPIRNEIGKPLFLLGISEDITERKQQQDAILKLNEELEAFSHSVSHDLCTPLQDIRNIAALLESEHGSTLDPEGFRLVGILRRSAQNMSDLIQGLLSLTKLGNRELSVCSVNITQLAKEAFDDVKIKWPGSKAKFILREAPPVTADKLLLHQVLASLFSNALIFSSRKPEPVIEFGYSEMDGNHVYFVRDNGAGFDMNNKDTLFLVFQRLHAQSEYDGSGLEFTITERIISKHQGKIWAEASPDKGATFYFTLEKSH